MKRHVIVLLILLSQALPAPSQQSQKSTIEGVVVRAGMSEPMPGVPVKLSMATGPIEPYMQVPGKILNADSQGRFAFKEVDAGFYLVNVIADRYSIQPDDKQRWLPSQGLLLNLAAGQSLKGIEIHLAAAGVLSGRITNAAGQPLAGIAAELLRSQYDEYGRRRLDTVVGATSNDKGEYRLTSIPPGRYFLEAKTPWAPNTNPANGYGAALFPGVTDLSEAALMDVELGSEVVMKDMRLERQRMFAVRGRVVDGRTGQPPPEADVWITTTGSPIGPETITAMPKYNAADGSFEMRALGPGSFLLGVTILNRPQALLSFPPVLPPEANEASVKVSNADVNGVLLTLMPAVTLPARLSVEGQPFSSLPGWEAVRVSLMRSRDGIVQPGLRGPFPMNSPAKPDGTFQIQNVIPGELGLKITGLPPNTYVKSARLGPFDLLDRPLQFSGTTKDTLEVVLSPKGGRINGTVVNDAGQLSAATQAVLVPEQRRSHADLFKTAATDPNGRFEFTGIPPGDYKVFAWDGLPPFSYFDPDLLERAAKDRPQAPLHVAESSSQTVTVKRISNTAHGAQR